MFPMGMQSDTFVIKNFSLIVLFTQNQYCLVKWRNKMMKTQTHNKTTKLRKFLLMKRNRNIPKFSTQAKINFVRNRVAEKCRKLILISTVIKNSAIKWKKFESCKCRRYFSWEDFLLINSNTSYAVQSATSELSFEISTLAEKMF